MQKLFRIVLLLLGLTVVGTSWFTVVERWTILDSLYMTVITLSTVGFREIAPPSEPTKLFLVVFLISGISVFMYGAVELGEMVICAELRGWWKKAYMIQEIRSLEDHFIVCGFGRMGQMLCRHLADIQAPFVAIDRDEELLQVCDQHGWCFIVGDATDDRVLHEAGVSRALGLATVLTSDADNLFVVLSAKLISKKLRVIARAYDQRGVEKMQRAGAEHVVSLYASGATRMAQLLTNPKLGDFFEIVAEGGQTLDLAELTVGTRCTYAGKALRETDIRDAGVMIVAIRKATGKILLPPPSTAVIDPGDRLFALGDATAIAQFTSVLMGDETLMPND